MKNFLMMFALLIPILANAAETPSKVETYYDRFDKETVFSWYKQDDVNLNYETVTLQKMLKIFVPDNNSTSIFSVMLLGYGDISEKNADEDCYVDILANGNKVEFENKEAKYNPKDSNMFYIGTITTEGLNSLRTAKNIEFRICSDEYSLSSKEVSDIRNTVNSAMKFVNK